jgi:apolipoprotein N-acyltransferase
VPILLGSPHLESIRDGVLEGPVIEIPYNSAYLVDDQNSAIERYDKIRLVSFGEYVPWRAFFGPLGIERLAYSFGVSDFQAGKDFKVFSLKDKHRFSVLICFEDTFPFLARKFAGRGAEFLIVMTNDAWFGESAAPYQHLQASIFRAIENGIPVIRSANTGVSAFIDRKGKVTDRVKDKYGNDTFIAGGLLRSVELRQGETAYQKWGHWFPLFSLVFLMSSLILNWKRRGNS